MKNYPGRDHDNFEECVSGKKNRIAQSYTNFSNNQAKAAINMSYPRNCCSS